MKTRSLCWTTGGHTSAHCYVLFWLYGPKNWNPEPYELDYTNCLNTFFYISLKHLWRNRAIKTWQTLPRPRRWWGDYTKKRRQRNTARSCGLHSSGTGQTTAGLLRRTVGYHKRRAICWLSERPSPFKKDALQYCVTWHVKHGATRLYLPPRTFEVILNAVNPKTNLKLH
jgi:hypothetical protein